MVEQNPEPRVRFEPGSRAVGDNQTSLNGNSPSFGAHMLVTSYITIVEKQRVLSLVSRYLHQVCMFVWSMRLPNLNLVYQNVVDECISLKFKAHNMVHQCIWYINDKPHITSHDYSRSRYAEIDDYQHKGSLQRLVP